MPESLPNLERDRFTGVPMPETLRRLFREMCSDADLRFEWLGDLPQAEVDLLVASLTRFLLGNHDVPERSELYDAAALLLSLNARTATSGADIWRLLEQAVRDDEPGSSRHRQAASAVLIVAMDPRSPWATQARALLTARAPTGLPRVVWSSMMGESWPYEVPEWCTALMRATQDMLEIALPGAEVFPPEMLAELLAQATARGTAEPIARELLESGRRDIPPKALSGLLADPDPAVRALAIQLAHRTHPAR